VEISGRPKICGRTARPLSSCSFTSAVLPSETATVCLTGAQTNPPPFGRR
jgi:hypothetical protein